jgi:RNA polymerase sigma-70 factor (ECF subfamily)
MAEASQIESWITAAQQGERLAVAKLLAAYHPVLRNRADSHLDPALRTRYEPEDILQQTYVQVLKEVGHFENRGPNAFVNWVFTILDRKLIDARRAAHRQARDVARETPAEVLGPSQSYLNLLDFVYADSASPSREVRRDEAIGAMLACFSGLSEPHRLVLQLRFLQGLPVAEVAKRLEKTDGAVVALTKRALDALRKAMDHLGDFTRGG